MKKITKQEIYTTEENIKIAETIDLFKIVNEGHHKLFGNKNERKDAFHLHKKYGNKVIKIVEFIPTFNKAQKNQYYVIRKPSKLIEMISDVIDLKKKIDKQKIHDLSIIQKDIKERQDSLDSKKANLENDDWKVKAEAFRKKLRGL
jgi:hypothetical protein